MRRAFLLLTAVALSLTIAAPAATGIQDPPVVVTVVCNPQGSTARVNADPYRRTLNDVSRWRLNINRPNDNTIAIEPKPERRWPYTGESYASTNGLIEIPPDQFTGQTGEFWYQVAYTCDGVRQVLDPRMDIGG